MESKEQSLSKIVTALSGVNYGKDVEEKHIKRIANYLEEVTKEKGKSIIEILSVGSGGGGENLKLEIKYPGNVSKKNLSEEEVCQMLQCSSEQLDALIHGEYQTLHIKQYDADSGELLNTYIYNRGLVSFSHSTQGASANYTGYDCTGTYIADFNINRDPILGVYSMFFSYEQMS